MGFSPDYPLEGGILTQNNGANEKFYGIEEVAVKEIFNNEVEVPDEAKRVD
jgi:lipid-binding SYLF domain-containing protein|tara:strand:+ start:320 stop:472 length:153 start_codon:yes stop_codon:yes gene_type:complete